MPRLTENEAAMLGRRALRPERTDGEVLAVFVPGKLVNPLNGSHGHWSKHARWSKGWRDRTAQAILEAFNGFGITEWRAASRPTVAKVVTFHATVPSAFDDDNLRACCKPLRDALKDMLVIDDDRPKAGHTFEYTQEAKRAEGTVYGVRIGVALRGEPRA